MNERIKELAEHAKLRPVLLLKHWGTIDALTDSEQEELKQLEKFAELIVQECTDLISEWKSEPFPLDPDFVIETIKDHFGVE